MESLSINLPWTEVLDFLGFQQAVCTSLLVWKYRLSAMMEGDLELGEGKTRSQNKPFPCVS